MSENNNKMTQAMHRRDFLKHSAVAGAGHNKAANRNAGVTGLFYLMRRSVLIKASLISVWV